jgi:hypothetical protein
MARELRDQLYDVLWMATAERDKRQEKDAEGIPAWVWHERAVLLKVVNEEREKRGLAPATVADVRKGEAVGHPHYGRHLSDYCAKLAVGEI